MGLKRDGDTINYEHKLDDSIDAFGSLNQWQHAAEYHIVEDMMYHLNQLPCQDDRTIQMGMNEFRQKFVEANIVPIHQYIDSFIAMKKSKTARAHLIREGQTCPHTTRNIGEVQSAE